MSINNRPSRRHRTVALGTLAMPAALLATGVATAFERPAPGEVDAVTLVAAVAGATVVWLGVGLVSRFRRPGRTRRVVTAHEPS